MKLNKLILVSALISTLSLPALAASNIDQNSAVTTDNATGKMPGGMPMYRQGTMNQGNNGFSDMPMDMSQMDMNRMNMGQMDMGRMNMGNMNMRPGNYQGMPMMNMGQQNGMPMMPYRQNQMPTASPGAGHHAGSMNQQGGMPMMNMGQQGGMPMMKMMPQKMAEMQQHRARVETHLANIESSLQQLIELQKAK